MVRTNQVGRDCVSCLYLFTGSMWSVSLELEDNPVGCAQQSTSYINMDIYHNEDLALWILTKLSYDVKI